MNAHELKSMRTLLDKAKAELTAMNVERGDLDRRISIQKKKIAELERKSRCSGAFRVSEHALLRYAERVAGFDVQTATAAITAAVAPQCEKLGDGKYPVAGTFHAIVKDNTIVTIEPA